MDINTKNENPIKHIKHLFMTFRNGIVSDTLRKAGMKYDIIFGLQIPQISEIAREIKSNNSPDKLYDIAETLWADHNVRESRLLACWLYPVAMTTHEKAIELASDVKTREEADILCFRLLRNLPFASSLSDSLCLNNNPLIAYCGEALQRNLE